MGSQLTQVVCLFRFFRLNYPTCGGARSSYTNRESNFGRQKTQNLPDRDREKGRPTRRRRGRQPQLSPPSPVAMQALLLPASHPAPSVSPRRHGGALPRHLPPALALQTIPSRFPSQSSSLSSRYSQLCKFPEKRTVVCASAAPTGFAAPSDESEKEKLAQV